MTAVDKFLIRTLISDAQLRNHHEDHGTYLCVDEFTNTFEWYLRFENALRAMLWYFRTELTYIDGRSRTHEYTRFVTDIESTARVYSNHEFSPDNAERIYTMKRNLQQSLFSTKQYHWNDSGTLIDNFNLNDSTIPARNWKDWIQIFLTSATCQRLW